MRDVAAVLGVATSTVCHLGARGKLAHVRVSNAIRFDVTTVAGYVCRRGTLDRRAPGANCVPPQKTSSESTRMRVPDVQPL
jgi:hypothetical protein